MTIAEGNGHASIQSMIPYMHTFTENQLELVKRIESDFYGSQPGSEVSNMPQNLKGDMVKELILELAEKNPQLLLEVQSALLAHNAVHPAR